MNEKYKTWVTREGKELPISTMSDSHIANCIGMLSKELAECVIEDGCWDIETTQRWIGVFFGELRRRHNSTHKITVNVSEKEKKQEAFKGKRASLCPVDDAYTIQLPSGRQAPLISDDTIREAKALDEEDEKKERAAMGIQYWDEVCINPYTPWLTKRFGR